MTGTTKAITVTFSLVERCKTLVDTADSDHRLQTVWTVGAPSEAEPTICKPSQVCVLDNMEEENAKEWDFEE